LGKTKIIAFIVPKSKASEVVFTYKGERIEVISSYVYKGYLFSRPHFSLTPMVETT
jgi:hypothetical protein